MEDNEQELLTELLSREYSGSPTETSQDDKFDKAKLKKLQLLIDQSKAFSQIISSSLVQQHTENTENKSSVDTINTEPALKKQKKSLDAEQINTAPLNTYEQPKTLKNVTLKPHQIHGMNWLISLYENGLNGILADEMGLGKTVQTISLLCFLLEQGIQGPFLIVSPLSVVSNWTVELSTFAPSLTFVAYVGDKAHRQKLRRKSLKKFNVVVTSYEISLVDFPYLKNTSWSYLVVDEGHRLKNANCMLFTKLKALHVSNRLLLTGTPLQNNLAELWSLLNFILPDVFHDFATFQSYFNFSEFETLVDGNTSKENKEKTEAFNTLISMEIRKALVNNLHTILKPFILRRLKQDVLNLPPKREYIVYSYLSPLQSFLYSQMLQQESNFRSTLLHTFFPIYIKYNFPTLKKYIEEFLKFKEGKIDEIKIKTDKKTLKSLNEHYTFVESQLKMKRILNPLMQLRQLCDSPYHYFFPWNDDTKVTPELILDTAKLQSLDSIIPKLFKTHPDEKILIFSQFKSTLELLNTYFEEHPATNFNAENENLFPIKTCTITGSSSKYERDEAIETFATNPEYKIFLLSTRAANLGLNLTAATTVILYDSDLNPMVDLQAIARVHRIGQNKPCLVYRLATHATVEEAIWERVIKKRVLEGIVIELGDFTGSEEWKSDALKDKKFKSKKELILDSLLSFYSSKSSRSALNQYEDPSQAKSFLKSNSLTEEELDEITSHDLEKYADERQLDETKMPHIKLLSESDVTGQNVFDDTIA
jgi:ATP-dependent DNA helicase